MHKCNNNIILCLSLVYTNSLCSITNNYKSLWLLHIIGYWTLLLKAELPTTKKTMNLYLLKLFQQQFQTFKIFIVQRIWPWHTLSLPLSSTAFQHLPSSRKYVVNQCFKCLSLSSPQPPPPLFPRRMYTFADTDVYNIHTILSRVLGCYKLSNSNNRMQPFEAIHRQSVATKHEATATFYLHHTPIGNQALAPPPCTCISKPLIQKKKREAR